MLTYTFKRLLFLIPTLVAVSFVAFLVMYLVPGDAAIAIAGNDATEADLAIIREKYGLDQSFIVQYWRYLTNILTGDLGESIRSRQSVSDEILRRLPATVELAVASMLVAVTIGVPFGMIAAQKPGSAADNALRMFSTLGISAPGFFLGLVLMFFFAAKLGWLPPTGRGGWQHLILPALTLGLTDIAVIARLTRSSMIDVLSEDYVRTARAKGLPERVVVMRHALINASIPVITVVGTNFGKLLGGAVIAETIFAWPGLGRYMIESIIQRDLFAVQACILFFSICIILVNLIVDLAYALIDPRISYR